MIRLRPLSVFMSVVTLVLVPAVWAEDKPTAPGKPASPWLLDRSLSVSPQAAPVPSLEYRLLPAPWELKDGNAVPIYLRLVHEQDDAARKYWFQTPKPWNALAVDKIPLGDARKFLESQRRVLRQLEFGARRRTAEWNYTLEQEDPISILLPDAQTMRNYAPIMILQTRVAIAEGDFRAAVHHLQTGFAFSRHVAEGPFLVNSLVGWSIWLQFAGVVVDFIERRDAPNLYWALTALPHPLFDVRENLEREYRLLELQIPEMGDLDRERTAAQWDATLRRVRMELLRLAQQEGSKIFPKGFAPEDPAAHSADLPTARTYVARMKRLSAEQVAAMPPAQVLLLYMEGTWREDRDDWHRGAYLPYWQGRAAFETANQRLREAPMTEGHAASRLLLPALNNVMWAQTRDERYLAALRIIEALRMHAAAHDGKLPDKLDDVTEVPVPNDPGTNKPFEYKREGDAATLVSRIPDDPRPGGLRFRLTVRKK